jgi:hypothetical protein
LIGVPFLFSSYDFFLVSQNVRQGTVSPTNYNVIYDESKVMPDSIQILTNKMCHLYFNWSGTVAGTSNNLSLFTYFGVSFEMEIRNLIRGIYMIFSAGSVPVCTQVGVFDGRGSQ